MLNCFNIVCNIQYPFFISSTLLCVVFPPEKIIHAIGIFLIKHSFNVCEKTSKSIVPSSVSEILIHLLPIPNCSQTDSIE